MRNLNYQLKQLGQRNRDGGYSTQAQRAWQLSLIANQLHELGFRQMGVRSLKQKHIVALTKLWEKQGVSIGTRKNRLSALRWWASKVGKQSVIAKENSFYGIGSRKHVVDYSRAQEIDPDKLAMIDDPYTVMSIRLQDAFGLRREEAIKFQPTYAIKDDHLQLKPSWCKGGRGRNVPITNDTQRALLEEVRALARGGSLIPAHLKYVQQLHRYESKTRRVGLRKLHGLRHGYAQRRFKEITGFACPNAYGPRSGQLTPQERALNEKARAMISAELGHARESITAVYLGR